MNVNCLNIHEGQRWFNLLMAFFIISGSFGTRMCGGMKMFASVIRLTIKEV